MHAQPRPRAVTSCHEDLSIAWARGVREARGSPMAPPSDRVSTHDAATRALRQWWLQPLSAGSHTRVGVGGWPRRRRRARPNTGSKRGIAVEWILCLHAAAPTARSRVASRRRGQGDAYRLHCGVRRVRATRGTVAGSLSTAASGGVAQFSTLSSENAEGGARAPGLTLNRTAGHLETLTAVARGAPQR
jgi:hypothetical protein